MKKLNTAKSLIVTSHHTWQIHILSKWSMADSLGCLGSEMPKAKGEGISLMVSDFLTADWVCLCDDNRCTVAGLVLWSHSHSPTPGGSEAQIIFWPGKNREGWFTADHLLAQVNHMINIFNGLTNGDAQALFIFDNAPSTKMLHSSGTLCSTWVGWLWLRRLACCWRNFCLRYSVRALGFWA